MVEMKNPIKEADAHPEINHLSLWRTDLAYFWVINCGAKLQDDMHYHENDDHIFMVLEGECTVRTPRKEFVLKQFDTVLLKSGEPYQLCNTGNGRMLLLGAVNLCFGSAPCPSCARMASVTVVALPSWRRRLRACKPQSGAVRISVPFAWPCSMPSPRLPIS